MENKINFTNLVICSLCYSRYWLLYCQAVDLQMNQTVEYQGAFPESWGLRASVSSFLVPLPLRFFISFAHRIYVVVQFYPWFKFSFLLFLVMVMYDNDFETKENKI